MTNALTTTKPAAGFGLLLSPETIEQVREFCKMLAATEFVPKAYRGKPDSIMVVGAMGARLGVDVFSAMAGIADINGRPSVYGDLMLAVCMNHPAFEDCLEVFEGKPYEDTFTAICTAKRKGREPVVRRFSVIEAKEASLWKKAGPWTATPQRMLQMRARAFALRDTFTDALAGFHAVEEMEGAIDVTSTSTVHEEPKPGKKREAKEKIAVETKAEAPIETKKEDAPNDDKDPVVILGADDKPAAADHPEHQPTRLQQAQAMDAKAVTVDVIWNRCTELMKTKDKGTYLQAVIKECNAAWAIKTVSDLGGETDDNRKNYLIDLETRIAKWVAEFGNGVAV